MPARKPIAWSVQFVGQILLSLIILETISGLMLPVTRAMQTVGADLVEAMTLISHLLTALNNLRNEVLFHNLWEQSVFVADQILDIKFKKSHIVKKCLQTQC